MREMTRVSGGPRRDENDLLGFVQTSTVSALEASRRLAEARRSRPLRGTVPRTRSL